ncbi:MAG: cupredoxin domain-containing protein [Pseudomonadota bacterium]
MLVIINILGLLLIALIVWWFWMATPRAVRIAGDIVDIRVAGGVYTPAQIQVPVGKPVRLRFLRQDATPCARQVVIPRLERVFELELNKPREVTLTFPESGEYEFACEMHMYVGRFLAA